MKNFVLTLFATLPINQRNYRDLCMWFLCKSAVIKSLLSKVFVLFQFAAASSSSYPSLNFVHSLLQWLISRNECTKYKIHIGSYLVFDRLSFSVLCIINERAHRLITEINSHKDCQSKDLSIIFIIYHKPRSDGNCIKNKNKRTNKRKQQQNQG